MTNTVHSVWRAEDDWSASPLSATFASVVDDLFATYEDVHDVTVIRAVAMSCRRRLERHRSDDASPELLRQLVVNHLDATAPTDGQSARDIRRMRRELSQPRHRATGVA